MPRKEQKRNLPKTPENQADQAATDDAIRKALNVRRPAGGWPWEKSKKPAVKSGRR
jgi:hypothetical protein